MLEYLNQWDSLVCVFLEEQVDQVFVLLRNLAFESNLLAGLVACNGFLVPAEGSIAVDELVQKNSKSPHVELVVVLPMVNHFRRHVFQSTAKSVSLSLVLVPIFI